MKIILAKPRGFCAGVERAIKCVEQALEQFGAPVYVLNDIVHNKTVVDDLREKGAVFVKARGEVTTGSQHHNTQARLEEMERSLATQLDLIDQLTSQITTLQKIVRKTLLLAVLAIGLGLVALGLVIFE